MKSAFVFFAGGSWINQGGRSLWVWVFQELLLQLGHPRRGADRARRGEKDSHQVAHRQESRLLPTALWHWITPNSRIHSYYCSVVTILSLNARDNIYFSIWDCWTISGHEDFTLSDFMNAVRVRTTSFTWAVNGHQLLIHDVWGPYWLLHFDSLSRRSME